MKPEIAQNQALGPVAPGTEEHLQSLRSRQTRMQLSRRSFLKRVGMATAGTIILLRMSSEHAFAEDDAASSCKCPTASYLKQFDALEQAKAALDTIAAEAKAAAATWVDNIPGQWWDDLISGWNNAQYTIWGLTISPPDLPTSAQLKAALKGLLNGLIDTELAKAKAAVKATYVVDCDYGGVKDKDGEKRCGFTGPSLDKPEDLTLNINLSIAGVGIKVECKGMFKEIGEPRFDVHTTGPTEKDHGKCPTDAPATGPTVQGKYYIRMTIGVDVTPGIGVNPIASTKIGGSFTLEGAPDKE